ncbi:hypothetical protein ACFWNK_02315 [Streptomyces sp. NPDC058417]|uniref:hypothetical protein n=1 Tax=unclassified Streptomyces TaxID=2593676 RepID=UPI00365E236E
MDHDADQQHPAEANPGHAAARLAAALTTARTHPDAGTRARAEERGRGWRAVLAGMADGRLTIGSRTPVKGLPAWVTPEVVRGGFATGKPSAGGPLRDHERETARAAGVPEDRGALFAYWLTEDGLTRLHAMLDSGRYAVTVPEEAALLTVAWLARAGETEAAVALAGELAPFADRLRFAPVPAARPAPDAGAVHLRTVGDAVGTLERRTPHRAVETQREALTVWLPFGDELLALWLETVPPGPVPGENAGTGPDEGPLRVLARAPDADWRARGSRLLRRYADLARRHTLCTKHRDPRQNQAILRDALAATLAGRALDARRLGLLRHAVTAMVRRRGLPGSPELTALRREQAAQAALPAHHTLARVLLPRLRDLPRDEGIAAPAPLLAPVTTAEAATSGVPAGTVIPAALRRPVEAALSAPLADLVDRGVVPSAEALAALAPQLVAATTARAFPDPALRTLTAAAYRAFRTRRSLLLLNLERQVRVEELPWVGAVDAWRDGGGDGRGTGEGDEVAARALRELGGLAVQAFPGTLLPNPLVRELSVLAGRAELGAPLVEELAADIFMGTFTPKFLAAARVAAELLGGGSLYERYYGIDYRAVRDLAIVEAAEGQRGSARPRTSPGFARLCAARAGLAPSRWRHGFGSPAVNGTVIEQAQILTTHNLATLVHRAGFVPATGWADLAERSFGTVCLLAARVPGNPRPLRTAKDAAYAWRQTLFHLSLCAPDERERVLAGLPERAARHSARVAELLAPALTGLRQVTEGGSADHGAGRLVLGWSTGGHWLREE